MKIRSGGGHQNPEKNKHPPPFIQDRRVIKFNIIIVTMKIFLWTPLTRAHSSQLQVILGI